MRRPLKKYKQKCDTKKGKLLQLLEKHGGSVPISVAAKKLYGRDGELQRLKVIKLLSAYRAGGFLSYHVRNHTIVETAGS